MKSVELLHDAQKQTEHWWSKAKEMYGDDALEGTPHVNFNLRGKCAGRAYLQSLEIKLNKTLMEENYDSFCSRTIPHEVAHIVSYQVFGSKGHDKYWKRVMRDFGCETSRGHNYDTSNATSFTLKQEFRYKCECSTYMFTKIRHNRSEKHGGAAYGCKKCGHKLVYTPE